MVALTTVLINKFSMKHFHANIHELLTELNNVQLSFSIYLTITFITIKIMYYKRKTYIIPDAFKLQR